MEVIMNFWWLWTIGAVGTFLYGAYNQISRMKRMMRNDIENGFFDGLYLLILAGVANFSFTVLLIVSIVLNILAHMGVPKG